MWYDGAGLCVGFLTLILHASRSVFLFAWLVSHCAIIPLQLLSVSNTLFVIIPNISSLLKRSPDLGDGSELTNDRQGASLTEAACPSKYP